MGVPYLIRQAAQSISQLTRYCDAVVQLAPQPHDRGTLLAAIECGRKVVAPTMADLAPLLAEAAASDLRIAVLLHATFNYSFDIQGTLACLRESVGRHARVVVIVYNPYLAWLYRVANWLGVRRAEVPWTFVTMTDIRNLCDLAGFEIVRVRRTGHFPLRLLGIGEAFSAIARTLPIVREICLAYMVVLRPRVAEARRPSLSIVIPARNERGNIRPALARIPDLGAPIEVIFVEGHSTDGTWDEILSALGDQAYPFRAFALKQQGRGKADAIRQGFAHATGELVTILDADLTMPPESLHRFYDAYCEGKADFVNGTRLVYPMENDAMRFLNWLGNIFFAKALSFSLDQPLGDSLCGTKLLSRADYARIERWRARFGDFDPFGDFELLFPAAMLGLGIRDVPVRYRARVYGSTNIHRFRDGLQLLRMLLTGFARIRAAP
jgi:hypothetical protein